MNYDKLLALLVYLVNMFSLNLCESHLDEKKINIIKRRDWGASKNINYNQYYFYDTHLEKSLCFIIIHHSAFKEQPGPMFILKYQIQNMGYDDIAYHFIIGKKGRIYEGRPINLVGAHAGQSKEANEKADSIRRCLLNEPIKEALKLDPDWGSIGICLDGNFNIYKPSKIQLDTIIKLLKYLQKRFNINKNNIILHKEVKSRIIEQKGLTFIGKNTECPGIFGSGKIKEIISAL